jgi:predicted dithiol-disulfide oxidoreductase (DUF899 family)
MVEVDGATPLVGEREMVTLLDAFEGRRMLIAYYFMWRTGRPAPEQCEGCTWAPTGWPQRFINGHGGQFRMDVPSPNGLA